MKVIYIDIDTLRPDHLGCYGYNHSITPNIDSLADDSHLWTNAFAAGTPCMPSRASVFTCQHNAKNGVETHGESALWIKTDYKTMLANVLATQNVYTATASSFGQHPSPWFFTGFCKVVDPALSSFTKHFQTVDGKEINKQGFEIIDNCESENMFLHLHYWDPHGPLVPPKEFLEEIDYTPDLSHITDDELSKLVKATYFRGGQQWGIKTRKDLEDMVKKYDAEIKYTDYLIGNLIEYLKKKKLYDSTAIILSSDHGEQYGEGGLIQEHGSVNDSCIRIPLLIKMPENKGGGSVHDDLVYGLDIGPTATEILKCTPSEEWHGKSLVPYMENKPHESREFVVCDHGLYTCQRAIRDKNWKMVHTYHSGIWEFPEYALFDLENDVNEVHDVSSENIEQLNSMIEIEVDWLQKIVNDGDDMLQVVANTCGPNGLSWI